MGRGCARLDLEHMMARICVWGVWEGEGVSREGLGGVVEIEGVWGKVRLRLLGGGKSWASGGKWEVLGFATFCLCIIVEGGVPV